MIKSNWRTIGLKEIFVIVYSSNITWSYDNKYSRIRVKFPEMKECAWPGTLRPLGYEVIIRLYDKT